MCRLDIRNNDGLTKKKQDMRNTTKYVLIHSRQLLFSEDISRRFFRWPTFATVLHDGKSGTVSHKKYLSPAPTLIHTQICVHAYCPRVRRENETFNEFTFQEVTKQCPLLRN